MTSARNKVPGLRNRESNGHAEGDHHYAAAPGTGNSAHGAGSRPDGT
jgi:hypothetical protein